MSNVTGRIKLVKDFLVNSGKMPTNGGWNGGENGKGNCRIMYIQVKINPSQILNDR